MYFKKARGFQTLFATFTLGIALLVTMSIESASAQGVLVTDTITSPSLEGNLLGDPATRNITIYLPPGYDTSDRRYPVLYLMPGLGASDRWWACGQLIRVLNLGHRDAGIYVSRAKAAYWDGKNEAGEEVASGIYFYSITTGDFSATRKMTVRK